MNSKIVLITGATSGIGEACARVFAEKKNNLIITGRRKERLENLAQELSQEHKVEILPLCFDIRDKEGTETAINSLPDTWNHIEVLVNNAGLAVGLNTIQEGETDDWERMIDTNIKGLLYISRLVSQLMIKQGKGHIINIGSIAGREVYPNGNVYCATKHAVDAITQGMRIDMVEHGIKVSQVAPGAVETEFSEVRFKGDTQKAGLTYQGYQPLTGKDVADVIYYLTTLPDHVNINDLLIMPTAQASATVFNKKV